MAKFKFKYDETLLYNMRKKLKELDKNDPYFYDLMFVIAEHKKIVYENVNQLDLLFYK